MEIEINNFPTKWNGGGDETVCGNGSRYKNSHNFRKILKQILARKDINIKTITDLGCGDGNIYKNFNIGNIDYLGYDIVPRGNHPFKTEIKNICDPNEEFRSTDLFICRDVMFHLPNEMCLEILRKVKIFGHYLLATTFSCQNNLNRHDSPSFGFIEINLEIEPFFLGSPIFKLQEYAKNLFIGLWEVK